MKEEKGHIVYTAEDIKHYITGEMPPADMHAMEMAALDDPLLAEAMEGYELMEQKDWSKELVSLKQQFNKEEESKIIPISKAESFKWWKAAAAIIVLGTTAVTAYIFTNKNNVAVVQEVAKVGTTTATDSSPIRKKDSTNTFADLQPADTNPQLIAKLDKPVVKNLPPVAMESNSIVSTPALADSISYYNNKVSSDYAVNEKRQDDIAVKKQGKDIAAAPATISNGNVEFERDSDKYFDASKAKAENSFGYKSQNNFSGVVFTIDNKPISYAHVNVAKSNKAVYTDVTGRFNFTSTDSSVRITVSSAGFASQKLTLQNSSSENKVILQPQDIATETITTSAAGKATAVRKPQTIIDSSALDAEPTGGWLEYNNYLNSNMQLPETAKQNNIHGEVEVSVKLKDNGDISKVKIAKPLCPECDAEAVRLVKEGPKWDAKGNKKAKVKVKF